MQSSEDDGKNITICDVFMVVTIQKRHFLPALLMILFVLTAPIAVLKGCSLNVAGKVSDLLELDQS